MAVLYEKIDRVATITLERRNQHNAMDRDTYNELTQAFDSLDVDSDVDVGIITGAGGAAFSSGADLKEMHGRSPVAPWSPALPERWDFGRTTSKPMIAAVNGYALAGGLELALACDIRIADANATFGAPEVKWDLLDGYGTYRLPQVVGLSNAMDLLLTGSFIDADEALRIGLVSRVEQPDELMETARAVAKMISTNGATSVKMTKELVQRGLGSSSEEHFRRMKCFYDAIEGSAEQHRRLATFD